MTKKIKFLLFKIEKIQLYIIVRGKIKLDDRKEDEKMARQEKELPIADIIVSYVGTEDDFMKFLRAVVIEYLTENIISAQDKLHENSA